MSKRNDALLKSCPFCGSEELEFCRTNPKACWVRCHLCGGEAPSRPKRRDAITNWNMRYPETIAQFVEDDEKPK